MSKPRLTKKVLDGLVLMMSVYDATSGEEFFGMVEGHMTDEEKLCVSQADAASDWCRPRV